MAPSTDPRHRRLKEPALPKLTVLYAPDGEPGYDGEYLSVHYQDLDLSHRELESAQFERCRFTGSSLAGSPLRDVGFTDVEMASVDLSNSTARDLSILRGSITASRLTGMRWVECGFRDLLVEDCRADLASFRFSVFKPTVVFRDCNLREVSFQSADLRGARFERCDLTGAQFSHAQMAGTRFADCVLAGLGGVASLKGAIIKSTDAMALVYSLAASMGITIED
ncbi:MAG: pentapeptide repeat-containing protein [Streptosporangiaceae bacterium]